MFADRFDNEKEFLKLYKKYFPKIYNYIARRFLNNEEAEDLTSITFMKAFDFFKRNKPEIRNFNAWIYKIATNEMMSRHRYIESKGSLSLDDEGEFHNDLLTNESQNKLDKHLDFMTMRKAMTDLKPVEKSLIELHYFEGFDYSEISEILEIKEVTLRSILHRVLKKLRKKMEE